MPTQLIGQTGYTGPREIGRETNQALTANILRLADATVQSNISKTKSAQFIQGKARIAQGESLETIRASQGVFDQIFGAGTMQGAEAQTVIQATDQHVLEMQSNMDQYKDMSTEEFIFAQQNYVSENLLTGNPSVDNLITLASSEAIADNTSIHAKKHAMHVQQKNKVAFEQTLMGASKRVNSAFNDPEMSTQDKVKALEAFRARLQPAPGQTSNAYANSVYDVVLAELKADRPEMYQGLVLGEIEVDKDTVLETGDPLAFDPDKLTKLNEAYTSYQGRTDNDLAMKLATDYAELQRMKGNTSITTTEMEELITQKDIENGADWLSLPQRSAILVGHSSKILQNTKDQSGIRSVLDGTSRNNTERNKVQKDLNLTDAALTTKYGEVEAEKMMIQLSMDNNLVPSSWTAQYNNGLSDLDDPGLFIGTMQKLNPKYEADPKLFLTGLTDEAKANYLGVKYLMETQNLEQSPEKALVQFKKYQLPQDEASELVRGSDYQKKIDTFLENPDQSSWYTFGLFDEYDTLRNPAELRNAVKFAITQNVARTGIVGDGAWMGAMQDIATRRESVMDYSVSTYGTPLSTQAGISDADVSFEEAFTYYMNTGNRFGEDFDSENVDYKFTRGYVSITPTKEDGTFLAPFKEYKVPFTEVGTVYNSEVTVPTELRKSKTFQGAITEFETGEPIPVDMQDIAPSALFKAFTSKAIKKFTPKADAEALAVDISEFGGGDPIPDIQATAEMVMQNKTAIGMVKGAEVDGSVQDIDIMQDLLDPKKGKTLKALVQTIPRQVESGNILGVRNTVAAIKRLTDKEKVEDFTSDIKTFNESMHKEEGMFHPRGYNEATGIHNAYKDTKGVWTIGAGHTSGVKKGDTGTTEEMQKYYKKDLKEAVNRAKDLPNFNKLDTPLKEVLVKVSFQAGSLYAWPKLIKALGENNRADIVKELKNSQWYRKDSPARAVRTLQNL